MRLFSLLRLCVLWGLGRKGKMKIYGDVSGLRDEKETSSQKGPNAYKMKKAMKKHIKMYAIVHTITYIHAY